MNGPTCPDAGGKVHGLIRNAGAPGEASIGGVGIGHQQHVALQSGQQMLVELAACDGALARDPVERLPGAVTCDQDAHLFV